VHGKAPLSFHSSRDPSRSRKGRLLRRHRCAVSAHCAAGPFPREKAYRGRSPGFRGVGIARPGVVAVSGVVVFAGSRSVVSGLVSPAVVSVLASGRDVVVGCARGVDAAVAATVCGWGLGRRLGVFAVSPVPAASWAAAAAADGASVVRVPRSAGRAAFAVRSRLVLAAAVAGGPGSGLVAFPSGPCPAVCRPVVGPVFSGRVSGGGSGSWLAVALAVGAGLPVVVFLPAGPSAPAWAGGSWVPAAASGLWASALRWSPSLLFGIPSGPGRLLASWSQPVGSPTGDPVPF
jgi:hypothetical protein